VSSTSCASTPAPAITPVSAPLKYSNCAGVMNMAACTATWSVRPAYAGNAASAVQSSAPAAPKNATRLSASTVRAAASAVKSTLGGAVPSKNALTGDVALTSAPNVPSTTGASTAVPGASVPGAPGDSTRRYLSQIDACATAGACDARYGRTMASMSVATTPALRSVLTSSSLKRRASPAVIVIGACTAAMSSEPVYAGNAGSVQPRSRPKKATSLATSAACCGEPAAVKSTVPPAPEPSKCLASGDASMAVNVPTTTLVSSASCDTPSSVAYFWQNDALAIAPRKLSRMARTAATSSADTPAPASTSSSTELK